MVHFHPAQNDGVVAIVRNDEITRSHPGWAVESRKVLLSFGN
jgi:hypothetical protein